MKNNFNKGYILLAWAGAEKEENRNFGDELSSYIVNNLSGKKVVKADFISKKLMVYQIFKSILTFNKSKLFSYSLQFYEKSYLLCVGSILSFAKCKGAIVWGSGIIDSNSKVNNFDFRAVRGPLTRSVLINLGYDIPEFYGDPALLLPLIYKNNQKSKYKVGLVPHIIHEEFFQDVNNKNVNLISLKGSGVEEIIDEICSCEYIFSSSLHGIIVAHAYGVPAVWVSLEEINLIGDDIKFIDYFQSVDFFQKQPIKFSQNLINLIDNNEFIHFFDNYNADILRLNINKRQKDLLDTVPFKICSKFK